MIVFRRPTAAEEPFAEVCERLTALCARLYELLPDATLSPMERLERLARVVPDSTLLSEHHRTGRSKLNELRHRLSELLPNDESDELAKIETLVARVHALVPHDFQGRFFRKLEHMGDRRRSDIGR